MAIYRRSLLTCCLAGVLLPAARASSQETYYDHYEDQQMQQQQQRQQQPQQFGQQDRVGLGVLLAEGERGVQIREVIPQSPAEQAGLRPGDEILRVNGNQVESAQQMTQALRRYEPGQEVEIRIVRNGEQRTLQARLTPRRQALRQFRQHSRQFGPEQQPGQYGQYQQRFRPPMQGRAWRPDEFGQRPPQDLVVTLQRLERQVNELRQTIRRLRSEIQQRQQQRGGAYRFDQPQYRQDMYQERREPQSRQYDY